MHSTVTCSSLLVVTEGIYCWTEESESRTERVIKPLTRDCSSFHTNIYVLHVCITGGVAWGEGGHYHLKQLTPFL